MSSPSLPQDVGLLAGLFTASGVVHLVRPEVFEPLVPAWVPHHEAVIVWSGVAELACAALLLVPATRRSGGWASAALLVGVYPGNLKMARDALRTRRTLVTALALARLPLQLPLVNIAVKAARG